MRSLTPTVRWSQCHTAGASTPFFLSLQLPPDNPANRRRLACCLLESYGIVSSPSASAPLTSKPLPHERESRSSQAQTRFSATASLLSKSESKSLRCRTDHGRKRASVRWNERSARLAVPRKPRHEENPTSGITQPTAHLSPPPHHLPAPSPTPAPSASAPGSSAPPRRRPTFRPQSANPPTAGGADGNRIHHRRGPPAPAAMPRAMGPGSHLPWPWLGYAVAGAARGGSW